MIQAKFSLESEEMEFVNAYQHYGYRDKSAMVRAALQRMKAILEEEELRQSAALYAEIYAEESDLRQLTDLAIAEWPE